MKLVRTIAAILLALPLLIFGSNYFIEFLPMPAPLDNAGFELLQMMRDGGLMTFVALSHVAVAIMLLIPRTRFLGALLQLPISLGIVFFHGTMEPAGLTFGVILLVLNLLALWNPDRLRSLIGSP